MIYCQPVLLFYCSGNYVIHYVIKQKQIILLFVCSTEQKEALLELLRHQIHHQITPEIRRELLNAKCRDVEVDEPMNDPHMQKTLQKQFQIDFFLRNKYEHIESSWFIHLTYMIWNQLAVELMSKLISKSNGYFSAIEGQIFYRLVNNVKYQEIGCLSCIFYQRTNYKNF